MSGFRTNKRRTPGGLHEAVSRAFAEAGGLEKAAAILGKGRTCTHAYSDENADPEKYAPMTLAQANTLTLFGVTALAEHFALACGGAFLPPIDERSGPVGAQAAVLGRETGEAMAALFAALADGKVTPAEARDALAEVRHVVTAATALYSVLQKLAESDGEADE